MEEKNICILLESLSRARGTEKIATIIANKLDSIGYNIVYLSLYNSDDKCNIKGEEFCLNENMTTNYFTKIFNFFKVSYKISKFCKENNIAIFLSHGEEVNFHNIISKLLFKNPSKIFIQIHSAINALANKEKFFIKKLYNIPDKIITIVKEEENNLIEKYSINKNKIKTIYNPVDIESINKLKDKEIGEYEQIFKNNKFTFINIARLSTEKNQSFLLNVFEKINQKYPNTQLIILGEGKLKNSLHKQKEKLKSKENIHFLGNHKNPYKFLNKADCFVLTSNTEGLPGVILESLALGIPVISTDCQTGPKEIFKKDIENFLEVDKLSFEEYGILSPINDEKSYFEAMETIYLDANLRENYKEKSLDRSKYFTFDKIMKSRKDIL